MDEIQNNITNSTQVQFQICPLKTNLGTPDAGNIVFIKDTNELYLDGTYYGLSANDAAALKTATQNIATLTGGVSDLTQAIGLLTNYVQNLRKFADGATEITLEGPVLTTHDSGVLQGKDNVKAAIDALAAAVDTLKAHTWTAVNKDPRDPKFATSVTQGTDGSIHVDYDDAMSTDVKRETNKNGIEGATVEDALRTLKGNLDTTNQNVSNNASAITKINGPENETGSIANAVKVAKEALIGMKPDVWGADEEHTLTQLRELISTLNGLDADTATRLKAIVDELKNADGTATGIDLANTLLDKFLQLYDNPTDGKFRVNEQDRTRLQDIITEIETEIGEKINGAIQGLNATISDQLAKDADTVVAGKHVGVKVVEENGELTSVTVVEDDIASANELSTLKTEVSGIKTTVEKHEGQLTWKVIS